MAMIFQKTAFCSFIKNLLEVGLSYLKLNQSLSTLSGGALQRVKLADTLHKKAIYLMDEPTDGLHLVDIQQSSTFQSNGRKEKLDFIRTSRCD